MQLEKTLLLVAAALLMGLVGWSCSSDPGGAAKPQPPKSGAAEKPVPTATENPAVTATAEVPPKEAPTPTASAAGATVGTGVPLRLHPAQPTGIPTPMPFPPPSGTELLGTARPRILVPEGCSNLALDKPVTSSTKYFLTGDLKMVTDGITNGSEGGYVALSQGKQWIQIDLEAPARIYAVVIYHYALEQRVYHDVIVQISDDPDFIKDVKTVFNNDYDNSSGLGVGKDAEYVEDYHGRAIPVDGVVGRYVRLWSNGNLANDNNSYIEVEVHGKPAK